MWGRARLAPHCQKLRGSGPPRDYLRCWCYMSWRLQRELNAAARVVSDTQNFDRGLSRLMHTELHWLDVPERVQYKLGVLMYRYQHNQAPRYLTDHCTPISDTVFCQRLHSASSHQVSVPRYRLSTYGRRAFSVAGPTVWNSLPEDMQDL